MIKGIHAMFYTSAPEELRAFLRDKLGLRWVDVGDGWLIFDAPEGELGCHPAAEGERCPPGTHTISFYCDDLERTIADLKVKEVEFEGDIADAGFGRITHFAMPGGVVAELYEPRHRTEFLEQTVEFDEPVPEWNS